MNGGKLVIETELDTKSFDAQIEATRKKLELLEKSADESNVPKQFRRSAEETRKLNAEIEVTRNKLIGLQTQQAKLNNVTEKTTNTTTIGFSKGLKTLKKFALGIIGIRSAYMLARKAASSYMAQDEELSKKMQGFWVGLGSFLAPVLEMLSDAMMKALGYLNVFIKALTGIDYIARANAKALQKQTKATKEAVNSLSSLDEIENISLGDKLGGLDSDLKAPMIEIPELDENIVKKLQDLAKWLKENWDWIWKVGAALAGVFLVSKLAGVLGGIATLIGGGSTGLVGLLALLGAVAVGWVIKLTVDGMAAIDDVIKASESWIDHNDQVIETYEKIDEKSKEQSENYAGYLQRNTERAKEQLDELQKQKNLFSDITGETGKLTESQQKQIDSIKQNADAMIKLKQEGNLTKEQQKTYAKELKDVIKKSNELGLSTKDLKKAYHDLTGKYYTVNVKTKIDTKAIDKLVKTVEALESLDASGGLKIADRWQLTNAKIKLLMARGYAHGGLVTQPTQALIGEAGYNEYVVPERSDYLSRLANNIIENMPAGGLSDDLLLELNRNITELANRPIILNVNGKELAQATYQDFQSESNRLNSSTSISIK